MTACVALPLRSLAEAATSSSLAVGSGLLVTAGILFLVPLLSNRPKNSIFKTALVVGLIQGLVVFSGVSRSGSTIAASLFMGLAASEAFRLSFFMSIPAIAGATLLEIIQVMRYPVLTLPNGWLVAMLVAFLIGISSLALLRRLVLSGKWAYFGIYCLFVGLFVVLYEAAAYF